LYRKLSFTNFRSYCKCGNIRWL